VRGGHTDPSYDCTFSGDHPVDFRIHPREGLDRIGVEARLHERLGYMEIPGDGDGRDSIVMDGGFTGGSVAYDDASRGGELRR